MQKVQDFDYKYTLIISEKLVYYKVNYNVTSTFIHTISAKNVTY